MSKLSGSSSFGANFSATARFNMFSFSTHLFSFKMVEAAGVEPASTISLSQVIHKRLVQKHHLKLRISS